MNKNYQIIIDHVRWSCGDGCCSDSWLDWYVKNDDDKIIDQNKNEIINTSNENKYSCAKMLMSKYNVPEKNVSYVDTFEPNIDNPYE